MRKTLAGIFALGLILAIPGESLGLAFGPGEYFRVAAFIGPQKPCTKVLVEIGAASKLVELDAGCLMIEFVNHKPLSLVEVTVQIPEEYEITTDDFLLGFSGQGNPYWVSNEFATDSYCYPTNFVHIFVYLHGNFKYLDDSFHQGRSILPRFVVSAKAVS